MLYDFLFGKGIRGGGVVKRAITDNKTRLNAALVRLKVRRKVSSNLELLPPQLRSTSTVRQPVVGLPLCQSVCDTPVASRLLASSQFPRYVRVNTLKTSIPDAMATLSREYAVEVDALLPELLLLPPGTDLHDHPLVTSSACVLQDKSSCFSAHALAAGWEIDPRADFIDACAAPGNKTRHARVMCGVVGPRV